MINETHLYREISEQPEVLTRLLANELQVVDALVDTIRAREISYVVIAARGSSDNAARYAKYLLGARNHLQVALATPSLFTVYRQPPQFHNALVLGISQSGRSPDIVNVLEEARDQGVLTAAITNHPSSEMGKAADYVINLQAGKERSIAATKTYTSQLAAISMISTRLAGDQKMLNDLQAIPQIISETLKIDHQIRDVAQRYRYMDACVVIGRGYNYATAFELALKLKELTYTVAEPYSSADFLHGPMAMVATGFPVLVIAPSGVLIPEIKQLIHTLNEKYAEVVAISDVEQVSDLARIPLRLPVTVPEWLSPITCIIPGQLLALYLADARDYDPDHPRGLRKITKTR
jgi:glucosamine--fructose-6-phosphate aminotransferase (isomerizing)